MSDSHSSANESLSPAGGSPIEPRPAARFRPDPPPLRLIHLLLYTAVCSAFIAFVGLPRMIYKIHSFLPAPGFETRARIDAVLRDVCLSALVTVAVVVVVWWLKGMRVGNQPGQWIAIWASWSLVSTVCVVKLIDAAEWCVNVQNADDFILMWPWAKSFYLLQDAPFALLFLAFAWGWRKIADNWAWKLYFGFVGIRLAYSALHHLPYHWSDSLLGKLPGPVSTVLFPFSGATIAVLVIALLMDLLPGRFRRHWSHWVAAIQPVLLVILDVVVWREVPWQDLPAWVR
jgi:hypothetical protein